MPVDLGDRSYNVHVGPGVAGLLAQVVAQVAPRAKRAAIVTQQHLGFTVDAGIEQRVFTIDDGEDNKALATIESLCSGFAQWGVTRADVVVAVGGGLVTDVGGFAAAVYHRGIAVIYISTTLLGQIDAAVGGKTAVNLPEGKNLVGAFHQPSAVLCDTELLASMPPREWRSGYGEMAKYQFLGAGDLRELALTEQIARCVEFKAQVVAEDEREGGRRAILNYGHTLAHALEISGGFGMRHGEAVGVGMVYAASLAHRLGRIDEARVQEHREVMAHYDLPLRPPSALDKDEIIALFARDKKAVDGITFVLDGPAGVEVVDDVSHDHMAAALDDLLATP